MERWTTSRKRRKRYRRQRSAANADQKPVQHGYGQGLPMNLTDCHLISKAMREGWSPSRNALKNAPKDLVELASSGTPSQRLAAIRLLFRMERANQGC